MMMTSAQFVETSITVTDNSPFHDYPEHSDDHTTRSTVTPGFKLFTVILGHFVANAAARLENRVPLLTRHSELILVNYLN